MNFPAGLTEGQIESYKAIFTSGDGEQLLREWGNSFSLHGSARRILSTAVSDRWLDAMRRDSGACGCPLDIAHLRNGMEAGNTEFVLACLRVLPDRFFELRQPLACRDWDQFINVVHNRVFAYSGNPEKGARYHEPLELMAKRGWDPLYGTRVSLSGAHKKTDWGLKPLVWELLSAPGNTAFLRRLLPRAGGPERLRRYSDSHCEGMAQDEYASTLLHRAALTRDLEAVRFLVTEVGIDPNTVDATGRTILMTDMWFAAGVNLPGSASGKELAEELLRLGLEVDRPDIDGETALVYAVRGGYPKAVDFLIERGASLKVRDSEGRTLLEVAERRGRDAVARVLRSAGVGEMIDEAMPQEESPSPARGTGGMVL